MSPDDAPLELVLGPAHTLLIDHLTNMTAMQRAVCTKAVDEYKELQAEHLRLLVELARVTQNLMVIQNPGLPHIPEAPRPPKPSKPKRKR